MCVWCLVEMKRLESDDVADKKGSLWNVPSAGKSDNLNRLRCDFVPCLGLLRIYRVLETNWDGCGLGQHL